MGDNYRFRDVTGGAGGINIGDGNVSVGGDYQDNRSWQRIDNRGGIYAGGDLSVSLGQDLELLTRALAELRLTPAERQRAGRALDEARVAAAAHDQAGIGGHLRRFTEALKDAGALASAGGSVVEALTRIGRWLGPVGAALLALL
ncbi:MAG TPA: hypothetical protein VGX25_26675 [Actinophytocola sp.]|uniref:hypothetical protein n=1 Tax=Actinophytocola sp. TaxID=1872138 RepID=UPI002DDD20E7|nr:hypothetical protein [Actinophytocola sp.]HEV2782987.1 hypothetical protein [Actinophytocola sp.]